MVHIEADKISTQLKKFEKIQFSAVLVAVDLDKQIQGQYFITRYIVLAEAYSTN
jgi:hypothetical protein